MIPFSIVIFISGGNAGTEGIQSGRFLKKKGSRGDGEVLLAVSVRSTGDCARHCVGTDGCNLYNLGPEDDWTRRMQCELVTRDIAERGVISSDADGWVMNVRVGTVKTRCF